MTTEQKFGNSLAQKIAKGIQKGHQVIANFNNQNYIIIGKEIYGRKSSQECIRLSTHLIHAYFFDYESFENWLTNRYDSDFKEYNSENNLLTRQLLENEIIRWQKSKTIGSSDFYNYPAEWQSDDVFIRYATNENYIAINSQHVHGSEQYGHWDPHGPFSDDFVEDYESAYYKFSHLGVVADYLRLNKFLP
jgi:hypothetical protein